MNRLLLVLVTAAVTAAAIVVAVHAVTDQAAADGPDPADPRTRHLRAVS